MWKSAKQKFPQNCNLPPKPIFKMKKTFLYLFAAIILTGCSEFSNSENQKFTPDNSNFQYSGRHEKLDETVALIASASSVKANVLGDTAVVYLQSGNEQHHYVTVELNGEKKGRFKIKNDSLSFALNSEEENLLAIYKDTEAANGSVIFKGISAEEIVEISEDEKPKIEFIGNSITCGMGADASEIPCEEGEWYDQHNAYLAYGPRVARALNVDFELNCVSGMGIYRNWNDEDQPVMPDVYENLALDMDESKEVEFNDAPDIISIALGTNDLSFGDGEKERAEFNKDKFVENYVAFLNKIYSHYPDVKIALISSPMLGQDERKILISHLQDVKSVFKDKKIEVFEFEKMNGQGCTTHPNVEDHEKMAEMLIPFYKNFLEQ